MVAAPLIVQLGGQRVDGGGSSIRGRTPLFRLSETVVNSLRLRQLMLVS